MNKGLLVDIGGTNMRYAIASNDQEDISKINKTEFDTLDFETFLRKLIHFLVYQKKKLLKILNYKLI